MMSPQGYDSGGGAEAPPPRARLQKVGISAVRVVRAVTPRRRPDVWKGARRYRALQSVTERVETRRELNGVIQLPPLWRREINTFCWKGPGPFPSASTLNLIIITLCPPPAPKRSHISQPCPLPFASQTPQL